MGENLINGSFDLKKFQEKLAKDFFDFKRYMDGVAGAYLSTDVEEEIGSAPKKKVFENEIMELYLYEGKKTVPMLIVNPLINGYYVLDLLPEISFTRFLINQDYAPYIIKWKNIPDYQEELDFDYYISSGVKKAVDYVYSHEKKKKMVLLGHCLGGVLASAYLSAFGQKEVSKYISLNSPYDFSKMGEVGRLTSKEMVDIDKMVDSLGNVPADFMNLSFSFINPGVRWKGMMALFHYYFNKPFMRIYKAMMQWKDDNIDMPGEFSRKLIKEFFQENRFFDEKLSINGKKISLKKIKIPVLNIMSTMDDVAPLEACQGIEEKVENVKSMTLPDGHLAIISMALMGVPHLPYWKEILAWLQEA